MASQYTSEKKTVGELLSMTSPSIVVPEWQRNFSWDTSQVETFWQDLLVFDGAYPGDNLRDQEYFLGTIVIVDAESNYLLLDGQQRLATATVLLSVIRDYLSQYKKDAATRLSQKYITDFDDAYGENAYKLTLNGYDRDFFRREVQDTGVGDKAIPSLQSHNQIRRARTFFDRQFSVKYEQLTGGRRAFDWALRIWKVLVDHFSIVAVTSADEDNAASVFETLNDRGIGLSTPDLLRSLLLQRAPEADRKEMVDSWRTILEVADDAKVQDFLRHYWLSHRGDVKTRSLYREIKSHVMSEDIKSLPFTRELENSALIYRDLAAGRDDDPDLHRLLLGLNQLAAGSLMPALLSAYDVGDVEQRQRTLSALLSLFVRHNVIGRLENSRLESVVFGIARALRERADFDSAIEQIKTLAPDDEQFQRQFAQARIPRRDTARYVLSSLELAMQATGEVAVELPDRVHVEHIYPQRPAVTARWESHSNYVDRIGNLTLLAKRFNQAISNADFATKKARYEDSKLLITRDLLKYEEWSPEAVELRQQHLAQMAVQVWAFPP